MEKQLQQLRAAEPLLPPPVSLSERETLKAELAAKDAALEEIEAEKSKAERDAATFRDEAGELGQRELEKGDNELRRARLIGDALLMGRVIDYAEEGGFVTFEVLMPESVQAGVTLGIRRKTGIIGLLKVSEISPEGAIANLLPGIGQFKPQPGDELILPPQY